MPKEELTPIEKSRSDTGIRFYAMEQRDYTSFVAKLDVANGYPKGVLSRAKTLTSLHPLAKSPKTKEGKVIIRLKERRVSLKVLDVITKEGVKLTESLKLTEIDPTR